MVVRTEAQHANVPFSVFDKTSEEFCELSLGMTPNELGVVFEGLALQGLKGALLRLLSAIPLLTCGNPGRREE